MVAKQHQRNACPVSGCCQALQISRKYVMALELRNRRGLLQRFTCWCTSACQFCTRLRSTQRFEALTRHEASRTQMCASARTPRRLTDTITRVTERHSLMAAVIQIQIMITIIIIIMIIIIIIIIIIILTIVIIVLVTLIARITTMIITAITTIIATIISSFANSQ